MILGITSDSSTITTSFERLSHPSSLHCLPSITRVISDMQADTCALTCLDHGLCLMFAVDGASCVLTEYRDGTAATQEQFEVYQNWYIIRDWNNIWLIGKKNLLFNYMYNKLCLITTGHIFPSIFYSDVHTHLRNN